MLPGRGALTQGLQAHPGLIMQLVQDGRRCFEQGIRHVPHGSDRACACCQQVAIQQLGQLKVRVILYQTFGF